MAKEMLPVTSDPYPALEVSGILREAFKLPFRNGKLMVSIMLLVLLPITLLLLLHDLLAAPLMEEFEVQGSEGGFSKIPQGLIILLVLEVIFFLSFSLVSLFGMTATICYSALTYMGKSVSLKEMLMMIRSTYKRLLITWLYILLLSLAYILLIVVFMAAFALVASVDAMGTWITLVGCLAAVFYLYLATVWTLGLVISVMEEGCYGLKALEKAGELIKGRKIQGFVLMLFLELLTGLISILFFLNVSDDDLSAISRLAFGSVGTVLFCIGKLFTFVVYTVFYYECKKSHGERVEIELRRGYSLVPSDLHVNVSLP